MFCQCPPATLCVVESRSYKRLGLEAAIAVAIALLVGALATYVAAGGSLFIL
jgi:hypothetical protein